MYYVQIKKYVCMFSKIMENFNYLVIYHKRRKIYWAKLSHFSWYSGVPQKIFCEFKCLSLIALNEWVLVAKTMQSISSKTSMALKSQIFSPVNLSPPMVAIMYIVKHFSGKKCWQISSTGSLPEK